MSILKLNHSFVQNTILIMLLISGTLKPFLNTFFINFDITLFMFFVVLFDIIYSLNIGVKLNKNKIIFLLCLALFYILIVISLIYTKSPKYSYIKTINFIPYLIYFIYPLFIGELIWSKILKILMVFILPLSIWFIIYRYYYWTDAFIAVRLKRDGFYNLRSMYLGIGSFLGFGALLVYFLNYKKIILFLLLGLLIATGARGALFFTLLIIFSHKLTGFWNRLRKRYPVKLSSRNITIIFCIFIVSIVIYLKGFLKEGVLKYGFARLYSLFNFSNDDSAMGRLNRFGFAIEKIFDNPFSILFGNGIGSFGIMYINKDIREYPHNIYIESWFELGLIGLLVIVFFTLLPFFLKRTLIYKILVIYFLLNAQKTGCLSDLWVLFALYGILVFNPIMKLKKAN